MNKYTFATLSLFIIRCRRHIGAIDATQFADNADYRLAIYAKVSQSANQELIDMAAKLSDKMAADSLKPERLRDEIPDLGRYRVIN